MLKAQWTLRARAQWSEREQRAFFRATPQLFACWEKFLQKELPRAHRRIAVEVDLSIVGATTIRRLNHDYRQKDRVTDVLSFPMWQGRDHWKEELCQAQPLLHLGSIVVALPVAQRQAKSFGLTLNEELWHLFTHGFLHLIGYDHELGPLDQQVMERLEARLLQQFSKSRIHG